jgi:hypothetical protein
MIHPARFLSIAVGVCAQPSRHAGEAMIRIWYLAVVPNA